MHSKKIYYILTATFLTFFSMISSALAEETGAPPSFNGTVFGLLFVYLIGLAALVLYGSSKTTDGSTTAQASKGGNKGRKR